MQIGAGQRPLSIHFQDGPTRSKGRQLDSINDYNRGVIAPDISHQFCEVCTCCGHSTYNVTPSDHMTCPNCGLRLNG